MKRLIAILLIAVMLLPVAVYSCDQIGEAVLPNVNTTTDLCGEVYAAVQTSTGFLYGMLSPDEKVSVAPAQTDAGRVRGITARGINRAKAEMRYLVAGETVCGLTRVDASVHISAQYLEAVTAIVQRDMGEGTEMTAAAVVACTIRRTASTVTHRMIGRGMDKIAVGTVLFSGAETAAVIYIVDWDGDGQLELALAVNPGPTTKATPEPTATPKPGKPKPKPTATPKPGCNPCVTIQINIEKILINQPTINIESIFKPCGKVEGC